MTEPVDREFWMYRFALKLDHLMRKRGMSSTALAKESGVARASIRLYLTGATMPSAYSVYRIARALKCETSAFMDADYA